MAESREAEDIFWVDPDFRGVIPLENFHISRSFKRFLKNNPFKVTCDTDFDSVIRGCAAPTKKREDSWINEKIIELFTELYHMGYGHSIEVWEDKKLVGGLYGVAIGGAFFAESMFSRKSQASKVALANLVARLKYSGFTLLDTQFMTDHLEGFGGEEISREEFKRRLTKALMLPVTFYDAPDQDGWLLESLTQSLTQTS